MVSGKRASDIKRHLILCSFALTFHRIKAKLICKLHSELLVENAFCRYISLKISKNAVKQ